MQKTQELTGDGELKTATFFVSQIKPNSLEHDFDLKPGKVWPTNGDKRNVTIDEYGRYIPSKVQFPNGFEDIIDHAHKHGVKFGMHLMRGIPREAVEKICPLRVQITLRKTLLTPQIYAAGVPSISPVMSKAFNAISRVDTLIQPLYALPNAWHGLTLTCVRFKAV